MQKEKKSHVRVATFASNAAGNAAVRLQKITFISSLLM